MRDCTSFSSSHRDYIYIREREKGRGREVSCCWRLVMDEEQASIGEKLLGRKESAVSAELSSTGGPKSGSRWVGDGWWESMVGEVRRQGAIALPMVLVNMFQFLLQIISLMMVGHLGRLSLSSASISSSLCNVTGYIILVILALSQTVHTHMNTVHRWTSVQSIIKRASCLCNFSLTYNYAYIFTRTQCTCASKGLTWMTNLLSLHSTLNTFMALLILKFTLASMLMDR